jgi:hypothetical protein
MMFFGELKDALGGLVLAVENDPSLLERPRLSLGKIRAQLYAKAFIKYVSFHDRRVLEAQISSPQPHALRKKESVEKQRWWEESKRLEEGVLLCMLWFDRGKSSLPFFTVSDKQTDPKSTHGLCSHGYLATITAWLATTSQRDVELMISKSPGNQVDILIEVPGVILATFIPILENLQDMQRLSRLPFRQ